MEATDAKALKALLATQRIAALATLHQDEPAVSMVPYALLPAGQGFVIHISLLAPHTQDMLLNPAVALLVSAPLAATDSALALPRVSIRGAARACLPDSAHYAAARAAYLARLPESEDLFSFADFSLFIIEPQAARYVAGFGKAMTITSTQLVDIMS